MANTETTANLDGGRFLADLYRKDSIQATFMQKIINAVNYTGQLAGVNPAGNRQAPPPVDNINIATSGEMMHVTLSQNGRTNKNAHYFVEVATNPNFNQPLVHHLGVSRSPTPMTLPTKDAAGKMQNYYVRAYCQYPGSAPSKITTYGGPLSPQAIQMSGSTQMDLLPSTGSGTASTTGQQGGSGFGKTNTQQVVTGPQKASINAVTPVK